MFCTFTTTDILFFPCLIYQYMYIFICYNTDMSSCSCSSSSSSSSSSFFFFFFVFFFFFFFSSNGCGLMLTWNRASTCILLLAITDGHTPVLKYWNMWNPLWLKEQTWTWCQSQIGRLHLFMSEFNVVAASLDYNVQCIAYKNQSTQLWLMIVTEFIHITG